MRWHNLAPEADDAFFRCIQNVFLFEVFTPGLHSHADAGLCSQGGWASGSSEHREQRQAVTEPDVTCPCRPGASHAFRSLVKALERAASQGSFSNPARESNTTEIQQQTRACFSSASKHGVVRERNYLATSPSSSSRARKRSSSPSLAIPAPVPGRCGDGSRQEGTGSRGGAPEPPGAVRCENKLRGGRRLRRPEAVSATALVIIVLLGISCTGNYYSPNFIIHYCDR